MKGKIDKGGFLYIERAGKTRNMDCHYAIWTNMKNGPNQQYNEPMPCGHGCALFGEPKEVEVNGQKRIRLPLCVRELTFTELDDNWERDCDEKQGGPINGQG